MHRNLYFYTAPNNQPNKKHIFHKCWEITYYNVGTYLFDFENGYSSGLGCGRFVDAFVQVERNSLW